MNFLGKKYGTGKLLNNSETQILKTGIEGITSLYSFFGFQLTDEQIKSLSPFISIEKFKGKSKIFPEGGVCDKIYYIVSGAVKCYSETQHTTVLALLNEGNILAPLTAIALDKPSNYTAEACSTTICLVIRKQDFPVYKNHLKKSDIAVFFFKVLNGILAYFKAIQQLKSLSTKDKISILHTEYAYLFQSFTVKDIAYLADIHPDTFSRERNSLFKSE